MAIIIDSIDQCQVYSLLTARHEILHQRRDSKDKQNKYQQAEQTHPHAPAHTPHFVHHWLTPFLRLKIASCRQPQLSIQIISNA